MERVNSSFIIAIGRNGKNTLVLIEGENKPREFENVSDTKHQAFRESDSKGRFFNFSIRPAHREVAAR